MTKADIRVLRNLTESKQRVMSNVVQQLEKREQRQSTRRWVYPIVTVILTSGIGLFIYIQSIPQQGQTASIPMSPAQEQTTSMPVPTVLDEKLLQHNLETIEVPKNSYPQREQELQKNVKLGFMNVESVFAYTQAKGMVPTQKQIDEVVTRWKQSEEYIYALKKLQLTEEQYWQEYGYNLAYKYATYELFILKNSQEQPLYKRLQEARAYLEQHYDKQYTYLTEKYAIPPEYTAYANEKAVTHSSVFGLVVEMTDTEFVVVPGALAKDIGKLTTQEMITKRGNGVRFKRKDTPKSLSVGDRVQVDYSEVAYYKEITTKSIKIIEEAP
ncbi:YobA family protein [Lysinibacillus piscis]|uniref:Uncharacterized protein n=1 Tax=Lysinibacillus piscis TaxID=2518931 RepID=A0ABQ5NLK0_9BACI|nr:YobA family protein [Lysinibacillus sp. KH24]GLC88998.1 hypothetical protein LYSBPC_21250 [Lysinibacillus sp. KH24]